MYRFNEPHEAKHGSRGREGVRNKAGEREREREREGREKRNSWLVRVEQRVADLPRRYTSKYVRAGRV